MDEPIERHPDLRSTSLLETRKETDTVVVSSPNCVAALDDPLEQISKFGMHHNHQDDSMSTGSMLDVTSDCSDSDPPLRPLSHILKASHELIDREDQMNALMSAFERSKITSSSSSSQVELTLITGRSGTGKSTLAFQLKKHVEAEGGYFLLGKFEQNQSMGLPYHALTNAFTDFVHQVMKRDNKEISELKLRIHQAIESDMKLLTDLIPILEQLVQDREETPPAKGADLQHRFKRVICKFVRAISSPAAPVVLMLDDLQWSDPSSVDLLRDIVMETKTQGFMIVGA